MIVNGLLPLHIFLGSLTIYNTMWAHIPNIYGWTEVKLKIKKNIKIIFVKKRKIFLFFIFSF